MKYASQIVLATLGSSMIILAGCASNTTNTVNANTSNINTVVANTGGVANSNTSNGNAVANTNTVNTNSENENTNAVTEVDVDTSDWLSYSDEDYGFSLSYPSNLKISQEDGPFDSAVYNGKVKAIYLSEDETRLVAIYPEGEFDSDRFTNAEISSTTLAGVTAEQYSLAHSIAYVLTDKPTDNPGKFRIEVFFNAEKQRSEIRAILSSLTLDTVNTSEWLTYSSDKFNFSFKYPANWGDVSSKNHSPSNNNTGYRILLLFSSITAQNTTISIESLDYRFTGISDGLELDFNDINTDLSDEELARALKRFDDSSLVVHKTELLGQTAIEVAETYMSLGEKQEYTYILIPDYNGYNIRITGPSTVSTEIDALAESLRSI